MNLTVKHLNKFFLHILLVVSIFCTEVYVKGACITKFPYSEGFESSKGSWTSGGTNSDWSWGSPSKSTITGAGGGSKCWIAGGLTSTSYKNGERAYVESPCFDFSSLKHPFIRFKVFWESEHKYDGANLQYSINSGSSWVNVGSSSDTNDCYTNNWYNYNSITYLATLATPKEGWSCNGKSTSGSCQGGFGSKKWVTAEHCLSTLTGQSSVIFRFTFGAGTSCNSYDGFAFDDVEILEAPKYPGKFGYTCVGVGKFNFIDSSTNCASNWSWNFGDPTSTTADTSTIQNPNHQYSKSGTYKVRLITSNSCSKDDTVFKTIIVPSVKSSFGYNCTGTNTLSFSDSTSGSPTSWSWNFGDVSSSSNTSTSQNPSHKFTKSGTYKVRLITHSSCSPMDTIIKTIIVTGVKSNFGYSCISNNTLSFTDSTSGSPTSWSWNFGDVSSSSNTSTLQTPSHKFTKSGIYTVTLISKGGCGSDTLKKSVNVTGVKSNFGYSCISNNTLSFTDSTSGSPTSWSWNFGDVSSSSNTNTLQTPSHKFTKSGTYTVTLISKGGCGIDSTIKTINIFGFTIITKPATCSNKNDGLATALVTGNNDKLYYQWSTNPIQKTDTAYGLKAGKYHVKISFSNNNCSANDTFTIYQPKPLVKSLFLQPSKCETNDGFIIANTSGGTPPYNYLWHPSGIKSDTLSNVAPGFYTLLIKDKNNCIDSIRANLTKSTKDCTQMLFVPNSFTPNNDGLNDGFGAYTAFPNNLINYQLKIFNRWGEQIFVSNNYNVKWDAYYNGTLCQMDVYLFIINYTFSNGDEKMISGTFHLLR